MKKPTKPINYRVLVVDEFDLLVTPKQNVIYNLLDWAHNQHSKLILIAIANTMNLPGTLIPKVQSRLGQDRLDFKAYLRAALEAILVSRLAKLDVFRPEAIMLIAAKIAAVSGDARRALEISRRSLKVAEKCYIDENGTEEGADNYKVSMAHVDTALKKMTPCHSIILKHAVLQQRLFICTIIIEVKITGKFESTFQTIANRHIMLCNTHNIPPPSWHTLTSICTHLGDMRFLKVGDVNLDINRPISLEISPDDVVLALAEDEICKKWLNLE